MRIPFAGQKISAAEVLPSSTPPHADTAYYSIAREKRIAESGSVHFAAAARLILGPETLELNSSENCVPFTRSNGLRGSSHLLPYPATIGKLMKKNLLTANMRQNRKSDLYVSMVSRNLFKSDFACTGSDRNRFIAAENRRADCYPEGASASWQPPCLALHKFHDLGIILWLAAARIAANARHARVGQAHPLFAP